MKFNMFFACVVIILFAFACTNKREIEFINNKDLTFIDTDRIGTEMFINRIDNIIVKANHRSIDQLKKSIDTCAISLLDSLNKGNNYDNCSMHFFMASDVMDENKIKLYSRNIKVSLFAESPPLCVYYCSRGKIYHKVVNEKFFTKPV